MTEPDYRVELVTYPPERITRRQMVEAMAVLGFNADDLHGYTIITPYKVRVEMANVVRLPPEGRPAAALPVTVLEYRIAEDGTHFQGPTNG